ncbi:TonB-dependent receptor [Porphyrobacter sp. YT40]|uniref:TonB-dependent receptor n=1 Tax=Porphyrobacter sp. YT40 TaxID=2547601 RepID=UPI0011430769|nr:TonB-dependent receptor [Porphyrobacter sp. YT40]QDH33162.1 TonB-dependent receptor [Porphyrobacter sp. YT40]
MKSYTSLRAMALLGAGMALMPTAAWAQDADTAEEEQPFADNVIIVTAQGRSQALADVPVAISAINSETLVNSGANDIRALNQVAPSLLVSSTGSEANGSARIRGIGTVGDNPGLESSVPVFIDGVYRSRSGIGLNELGEIDRIEVQRGPQGTLGGRNSSAGLISIYSKKPEFTFGGTGEVTYGNYDFVRIGGSVTGPISDTLAARVDGILVKRDGFYYDTANNTDVNDRDRYFVRGQLLFEPTPDISVRLIGDYTFRDEKCCAATYVDNSVNQFIGGLNNPSTPLTPLSPNGNNIINVLRDLGQNLGAFNQGYAREISVTPGRSFAGETKDYGVSGQIDWDFGGARLTSITAYREYRSGQASDTDYGTVDILYRGESDEAYRQFHTFTQEVRLQGEAFGGTLDWLVGGFFANEKLTVRDNLRFGSQYGRFANCRIISGGGLAGLYSPTNPLCVVPGVGPATLAGATGASGPDIVAAFTALDGLNDRGSTIDNYFQDGTNWALFTHNIVNITDRLALTLGLRYTNDEKDFSATFGNDNTVCTTVQGLVLDDLSSANATARALAGALIGLSCQGNSTAELNGVSIRDNRKEDEWTGTAILSYKATDDLLLYASFARGYKAGGFNLDRSALKAPIQPFSATTGGAQALVGNLQFDPELVDSYEIGAKYATGPFSLSLAAFRSDFSNFQLNTFNGTVFLVQNVNGCNGDLVGGPDADTDTSAATGSCAAGDVGYGVRTQGLELEAQMNPAADLNIAAGLTYAKTDYREDLVGNAAGAPLDPALRKLPGDNLSNAPEWVATGSFTWTPAIGDSGLSALFYMDGRLTSDFNTGSDLFPQKEQDGFALFNARVGIRGPEQKWSIEFWGQNIFDKDYAQVAINSPFQAGTTSAPFVDPQYPGGRQIFSQFLAEPRTYGITGRFNF